MPRDTYSSLEATSLGVRLPFTTSAKARAPSLAKSRNDRLA